MKLLTVFVENHMRAYEFIHAHHKHACSDRIEIRKIPYDSYNCVCMRESSVVLERIQIQMGKIKTNHLIQSNESHSVLSRTMEIYCLF